MGTKVARALWVFPLFLALALAGCGNSMISATPPDDGAEVLLSYKGSAIARMETMFKVTVRRTGMARRGDTGSLPIQAVKVKIVSENAGDAHTLETSLYRPEKPEEGELAAFSVPVEFKFGGKNNVIVEFNLDGREYHKLFLVFADGPGDGENH